MLTNYHTHTTQALSLAYRKTPYPYENLLRVIRKEEGRVILASDSHASDTLTCNFNDARAIILRIV